MVMMMVVLGAVRGIIAGAELEDVGERRYEEEQQLQEQLLRGAHAEQERYHEHELELDQLDDEQKGEEARHQFVLYKFP